MIRRAIILLFALHSPVWAQQPEQDPRLLSLALLRARAELEQADSAYVRMRHLRDRDLISAAEMEARLAERERAVLGVMERWVALNAAEPRLKVISAFKRRAANGETIARVRVRIDASTPPLDVAAIASRQMMDRVVTSAGVAFVSLKDEVGTAGTAIGVPYQHEWRQDPAGGGRDFDFRLLRDVEAVVVSLVSAGRVEERKVWLEADVSGTITVQSHPFSQEADVGSEASYELTLERFGGDDRPVRITVTGLPPSIPHVFTDPETGARIGQLRFAAGQHQRHLRLTLSMPAPDAAALAIDSAYRFRVVASPDGEPRVPGVGALPDDIRQSGTGVAELEVVPRGVGRAELRASNLYHELQEGQAADLAVAVRNIGTRPLDQVRVTVEGPSGWTVVSVPPELRSVAPNTERPVRLRLTPQRGAELGDFEARLRLEGSSGSTRLVVEPTVVRLRLRARTGGLATAALLGGLLILATGSVLLARKLGNR
ncbi:MAG TPA: NEW3 domain-containing protein [Gemmatimonadaceae bacterium]|nr:NEW3 domain-containing protein [Gemmatimonadaceae bacterium]